MRNVSFFILLMAVAAGSVFAQDADGTADAGASGTAAANRQEAAVKEEQGSFFDITLPQFLRRLDAARVSITAPNLAVEHDDGTKTVQYYAARVVRYTLVFGQQSERIKSVAVRADRIRNADDIRYWLNIAGPVIMTLRPDISQVEAYSYISRAQNEGSFTEDGLTVSFQFENNSDYVITVEAAE
jgi:hypothetical protein